MNRVRRLTLVVALLTTSWATAQNVVTDWNQTALDTILKETVKPHPGATGLLDTAMVHAAIYDAVESFSGKFRPYAVHVSGAAGSPEAAVAKAAHDVLVNRFPSQAAALETAYNASLAKYGFSPNDPGVTVGQTVAASIIELRKTDGSFPNPDTPPFTGGTAPGEWRPTISYLPGPPVSNSPMLVPWLATVTPFTIKSPAQFRPVPPPPLTSKRYADAYNEVKALGKHDGSSRTTEQTYMAQFFNANYVVLWNQTVQRIAFAQALNIENSARLFALVNMAMADAVITAWDSKRHYVFWRPVTAIQNGDKDNNADTVQDPSWQPLINTPNYPDYTSGANNVTAAATRSLALFFGADEMSFTVHTTNTNTALLPPEQMDRHYNRFSDVAADVVNARIYEGIHFRFADVQARKQGRHVAQWAFGHFLRPTDDDAQDEHADDEGDD